MKRWIPPHDGAADAHVDSPAIPPGRANPPNGPGDFSKDFLQFLMVCTKGHRRVLNFFAAIRTADPAPWPGAHPDDQRTADSSVAFWCPHVSQ